MKRPGYSNVFIILGPDGQVVGTEHGLANSLYQAARLGSIEIEECQPGRRRLRCIDGGVWVPGELTEELPTWANRQARSAT